MSISLVELEEDARRESVRLGSLVNGEPCFYAGNTYLVLAGFIEERDEHGRLSEAVCLTGDSSKRYSKAKFSLSTEVFKMDILSPLRVRRAR